MSSAMLVICICILCTVVSYMAGRHNLQLDWEQETHSLNIGTAAASFAEGYQSSVVAETTSVNGQITETTLRFSRMDVLELLYEYAKEIKAPMPWEGKSVYLHDIPAGFELRFKDK